MTAGGGAGHLLDVGVELDEGVGPCGRVNLVPVLAVELLGAAHHFYLIQNTNYPLHNPAPTTTCSLPPPAPSHHLPLQSSSHLGQVVQEGVGRLLAELLLGESEEAGLLLDDIAGDEGDEGDQGDEGDEDDHGD